MSSNPHIRSQAGSAKRTSFSGFPGGNTSILMEKAKASIRGSTPDSEAMASSDDEQEHYHRLNSINNNLPPKPMRRSSWLTETYQAPQRKGSMSGNGNFSPGSHPSTPSGDPTAWGTGVNQPAGSSTSRGHSTSASFPWGSAIWSNDSVKAPPSRLSEVLASSTGLGSGLTMEEPLISPPLVPLGRDNMAESSIPFAIPLHPTIKNYRSQSYSVGQMDPESVGASSTAMGATPVFQGRARGGTAYAGLQRRLSRPSMLTDINRDAAQLGQLREVEDDVDSSNGSEEGVKLTATQALTIEKLAMENAMLRQAAAKQIENTRIRSRTATGASTIKSITSRTSTQGLHQRIQESVPEELDSTYDEQNSQNRAQPYASDDMRGRRYSEYATNTRSDHLDVSASENQTLENVRKAQWQSSLGFGGLAEPPQSRRHSFADIVPPRHTSISSAHQLVNAFGTTDDGQDPSGRRGSTAGYEEGSSNLSQGGSGEYAHFRSRQNLEEYNLELEHLRHRDFAASYFSGPYHRQISSGVHSPSLSAAVLHQNHLMHNQYARPPQTGPPQLRPNQLLYVVTFKACRAEIFYVQEGTGLHIKAGDLVIVEADRGMDLGTVAQENIPWSKAKEYKDHYVEEHYRWLMMFSRQGQTEASGQQGLSLTGSSQAGATFEGMGRGTQAGTPDTASTEIKPKMIKRLAQAHEIQILKDKEGNEAKAKRICQQKVIEHRLNMEILDAEFQMDWKKLTFYYFADAYINFNTLVTDLFKIYKTRIWMSAINPASFVSSAVGLQLPSGLGPGAFTGEHDHYHDYRQQRDVQTRPSLGAVAGSRAGPDPIWAQSNDIGLSRSTGHPPVYINPFQPIGLVSRPSDAVPLDYHRSGQQSVAFQSQLESGGHPTTMPQPSMYLGPTPNGTGTYRKPQNQGILWSSALQGLSLNQ